MVEETQNKKGAKVQKQVEEMVEEVTTNQTNPLEDLRRQAESAYASYLGAQRKVTSAYRLREQEEVNNYKQVEQQANQTFDEVIQKAMAARIDRERAARENYEKELEKSAQTYNESVVEALKTCRETIEQKWQITRELSDQIWNIFQGPMSEQ